MAKNQIVALMFEEVKPGLMHETEASLKARIRDLFGFDSSLIVPLETGGHVAFKSDGRKYNVYDHAAFSVCGAGWSTDFSTLERAPQYDEGVER